MSWLKKINAVFLAIVLIAPVICVTVAATNDAANISSLIITTTEEEQEEEEEFENDNIKSFLPQASSVASIVRQLNYSVYTKRFNIQNRSRDVFSPPPELT